MNLLFRAGMTLATAAAFCSPAAIAQTLWTNTATQAITASSLVSAVDEGPAPADQALTVRVALALQNRPALLSYVSGINNPDNALYGQSLTPAQFAASYAPSAAQVQTVVSYLEGAGFENVTVEPNNLMVSADGTVALANAAFNTSIEQFSQSGSFV